MPILLRNLFLLLFFSLAALSQGSHPPAIGVSGSYRVGPGDVLMIQVFEVEDLSGPAVVGADGKISLPLLDPLNVAGLTTTQIEAALQEIYGRDYLRDPQITVSVRDYRSQPFSIMGAVRQPGVYQLQGQRRLLEVLAMAGGFSAEVGEVITIVRREPAAFTATGFEDPVPEADVVETIHVRVRDLLTLTADDPPIKPHDLIRVAKASVVYVMGAVDKPGEFLIRDQEPMTVLRAVSLAAGMARHSAPQKARILREVEGRKRAIAVPIKDILRGRRPDPKLEANDILFVPQSSARGALTRGAEAAIQVGTGIAIWRR